MRAAIRLVTGTRLATLRATTIRRGRRRKITSGETRESQQPITSRGGLAALRQFTISATARSAAAAT